METAVIALVAASALLIGAGVALIGFGFYSARVVHALARAELGEVLTGVESDRLASSSLRSEAAAMVDRAETSWNRARGAESRTKKRTGNGAQPDLTEEQYVAGLENGTLKVRPDLEAKFGW